MAGACAAAAIAAPAIFAEGATPGFERIYARTDSKKNPPIPKDKRSSGGLDYIRLDDDADGILFKFPKFADRLKKFKNPSLKLSLGNALENRCSFALFARSAKNGRIFSKLEVVNLFGFQVVRLDIPVSEAAEIENYGLVVTYAPIEVKDANVRKGEPVCFFAESAAKTLGAHAPHLLAYDAQYDVRRAFYG